MNEFMIVNANRGIIFEAHSFKTFDDLSFIYFYDEEDNAIGVYKRKWDYICKVTNKAIDEL